MADKIVPIIVVCIALAAAVGFTVFNLTAV